MAPDKKELVVYELLLRDFIGSRRYKDLADSLSYFKRLGVNAIELMPIMEFEGNLSWGYNPSYFFAPDKFYGSKNELKEFVQKAHQQGIAVILDMVLNHAFGQNAMGCAKDSEARGRSRARAGRQSRPRIFWPNPPGTDSLGRLLLSLGLPWGATQGCTSLRAPDPTCRVRTRDINGQALRMTA